MKLTMRSTFVTALVATLALAGCANQMEPAQKALAEVESTLSTTGADAAKYVPDQLKSVNDKLGELKAAFDKKDYKTVITGAPALLTEAKGLADAAAAKKKEFMEALNGQWTTLSSALPQQVTEIETRLGVLDKARKLPDGITKDTVTNAKAGLEQAKTLWGEATAAFGAGNLEEAVTKANGVKARADELVSVLGIAPAAPAAAPAAG